MAITPRQADKAIKSGRPIIIRDDRYGTDNIFEVLITSRTRWCVECIVNPEAVVGQTEVALLDRTDFTIIDGGA